MRAADLFCGAGGSSTGARAAGVNVVLAVNHWRTAVFSHEANHPETRHICARIDDIDPRHDDLPRFDLLMASPECTHHSIARGGMPVDDQKRATPWHVCAWAEARRPKWIIVENVREFRDWGPIYNGKPIKSRKGETFNAWLNALRSLGYTVEYQLLNAADFGAATKRIRLFVVARRGAGTIKWPTPTHAGRWKAAAEIIDWSRPCPSIFSRKRPLAEKTLRRIEIGLKKFVGTAADPFIVKLRGSRSGVGHAGDVHSHGDPLGTITAGGTHHAVAVPFQFKAIGRNPGATKPITDPIPTIVAARENHAIVCPYIVKYHGGNKEGRDGTERQHSLLEPLPTVDTQPRFGLAAPYLIDIHNHRRDGSDSSLAEPMPTIVTKPGNSLILPFLTQYYGTGHADAVTEPLATVTTKHRHGLAMAELLDTMGQLGVVDVGFRMLDVDELAAAQGFPVGYELRGTKAEQIKQVGNAVVPQVMEALCRAIKEVA